MHKRRAEALANASSTFTTFFSISIFFHVTDFFFEFNSRLSLWSDLLWLFDLRLFSLDVWVVVEWLWLPVIIVTALTLFLADDFLLH